MQSLCGKTLSSRTYFQTDHNHWKQSRHLKGPELFSSFTFSSEGHHHLHKQLNNSFLTSAAVFQPSRHGSQMTSVYCIASPGKKNDLLCLPKQLGMAKSTYTPINIQYHHDNDLEGEITQQMAHKHESSRATTVRLREGKVDRKEQPGNDQTRDWAADAIPSGLPVMPAR